MLRRLGVRGRRFGGRGSGGACYLVKAYAPATAGRLAFDAVAHPASDGSCLVYRITTRDNPSQLGIPRLSWVYAATCRPGSKTTLAYNAPQRSAGWANAVAGNFNSQPLTAVYCLGTTSESVAYTVAVPEGGAVVWEYAVNTVSGRAYVTITLDGTPIAAGLWSLSETGGNRYLDTLATSTQTDEIRTARLASGLPAGDYVVTITAAGTEATKRLYDRGLWSVAASGAGAPGAAPVVLEKTLGGGGNLEYAAFDGTDYYGGVHGDESSPSDHAIAAGADITAAMLDTTTALGTAWSSARPAFSWSGNLDSSDPFAALQYVYALGAHGLDVAVTRTKAAGTHRAVSLEQEYVGMIMAYNEANDGVNRIQWAGTAAPSVIGTTTPGTQVTVFPPVNSGATLYDDRQSISCAELLSPGVVASDGDSQDPRITQDRTDGLVKDYRAAIYQSAGNAIAVPDGVMTARYRYAGQFSASGGLLASIGGETIPLGVTDWTCLFDADWGVIRSGANVSQWLARIGTARATVPAASLTPQYGTSFGSGRASIDFASASTHALVTNNITHGAAYTVMIHLIPTASAQNYKLAIATDYTQDFYIGGAASGDNKWKAIINDGSAPLDGPTGGDVTLSTEFLLLLRVDGTNAKLYSGATEIGDATVVSAGTKTLPIYLNRTPAASLYGNWRIRRWGLLPAAIDATDRAALAALIGT